MVKGVDFVTLGDDNALRGVARVISIQHTIEVGAVLGAGRNDAKEVRIPNRYACWTSDSSRRWMEYEPDPRHAKMIARPVHLENAKGVTTPSVKKRLEGVSATFPQLDAAQTHLYCSVVMRAAYLSQDRPDLSFSAKELARKTQKPTDSSMTDHQDLGRYSKKRLQLVECFVEQTPTQSVATGRVWVAVTMRVASQNARARLTWY